MPQHAKPRRESRGEQARRYGLLLRCASDQGRWRFWILSACFGRPCQSSTATPLGAKRGIGVVCGRPRIPVASGNCPMRRRPGPWSCAIMTKPYPPLPCPVNHGVRSCEPFVFDGCFEQDTPRVHWDRSRNFRPRLKADGIKKFAAANSQNLREFAALGHAAELATARHRRSIAAHAKGRKRPPASPRHIHAGRQDRHQ